MPLPIKDFVTLVREQVTAIQGAAKRRVDVTVGSILRALTESFAAVMLWLQAMVVKLLTTTRASTSTGEDLDTWVQDYGLTRLPAVAATGYVTFARFTPAQQAIVPVGTPLETEDGTQQFVVQRETQHADYDEKRQAYVLAAGIAKILVPVQAQTSGRAGNVAAGTLNTLTQALAGIDTVTNEQMFTNGADAETDEALRQRFVTYMASLSKATVQAVGYAITAARAGLRYRLVENKTYEGKEKKGYFYVVVDDGSGMPTADMLAQVSHAIEAVRPLAIPFGVFAPEVIPVTVELTLHVAEGAVPEAVQAVVKTAIRDYINALDLGVGLAWSRLSQLAYDASPLITNVTGVLLNGKINDIALTVRQTLKTGVITIH
jgi:uncharacterized phage protein gp47/JayE